MAHIGNVFQPASEPLISSLSPKALPITFDYCKPLQKPHRAVEDILF